eukprot:759252-Prymnesium_polylepis.2
MNRHRSRELNPSRSAAMQISGGVTATRRPGSKALRRFGDDDGPRRGLDFHTTFQSSHVWPARHVVWANTFY